MIDYISIIDRYYSEQPELRELLLTHSRQVADLAAQIIERKHLSLDSDFVEEAAMLHDIGVVYTDAPSILCYGSEPYLRHGIIGAEMLEREGLPRHARVAATHIGAGLTATEIEEQGLPLPPRDFLPDSIEEKLVCYADNFFSKSHIGPARTVGQVRRSMARYGEGTMSRLEAMIAMFE